MTLFDTPKYCGKLTYRKQLSSHKLALIRYWNRKATFYIILQT